MKSVSHIHWGEYMSKLNRILWSGLVLVGAACGDDVTVVPPPEPPAPGIRAVTVAPDGATIAVGANLTFTAAVTTDPGAAAPTVAWSSSNTAVATVDPTSGVATGVAVGSVGIRATATSGTSTGSGVATLNVSNTAVTPATVSIKSITENGQVSNINDLDGQVEVTVNLERGGENVQRVQLLVDGNVVQEQVFASASAQASAPEFAIEEIEFPWNTAEFDPETGAVKHLNGPHQLSAKVITAQNQSGSGSPTLNIVLDNSNTAVINVEILNGASAGDANGETWWTGDLQTTVLPVIYSAASPTIAQVVMNPTGASMVTKTDTEAPYVQTWAKGTTFANGGSGGNGNPGIEDDEFEVCVSATVNGNSTGTIACSDEIRYDNQAPPAPTVFENPNGRQAGWVNDAVKFGEENGAAPLNPNGLLAIAPLDGGVGLETYPARAGATLAAAIAAADIADATGLAPTSTGQSLCLVLYSVDALGNRSGNPTTCDAGDADNNTLIGVDRAAPVVAYSTSTNPPASMGANARQSGASLGGEFIVVVTDTGAVGNSGVRKDILNNPIPVNSNVIRRSADGTKFGAANAPTDCVQGKETGTTIVCAQDTTGLFPATLSHNRTNIAGLTGGVTHGYYTHTAKAFDGAGNTTDLADGRVIVYDATPLTATAPAVPVTITGSFNAASFLNDDLSIRDYYFNVGYATALVAPTNINLGTPTVVDAFNAPTLNNINYGVNAAVNAYLGLQATVGGVPQAYAANSNPLNSLTLFARDQAQTTYSSSPPSALAPTPPASGIAVSGGPPAFTFNTYVLTTSQATLCSGTLVAGCAAGTFTSTVFTATANGTTGSFNNPFSRVDFYAANAAGTTLVLIGSVPAGSAGLNDDFANRAWTYSLPITAGALYSAIGAVSPAVAVVNIYAFGVNASGTVALVSGAVAQTLNP
jgi:hypothetical protein